jgi:hypothetical protein
MAQKLNHKDVNPRVTDSPNLPLDIRVKVTQVARPLLTPFAHSRTLLLIEVVCCCSWSV